jgi:hypothetical protein
VGTYQKEGQLVGELNFRTVALILLVAILLVSSAFAQYDPGKSMEKTTFGTAQGSLSPLQPVSNLTISSDFEIGYGPFAVSPISNEVPIYTLGDNMYVVSNYNVTVGVILYDGSAVLKSASVMPGTALTFYQFDVKSMATSSLNLSVSGPAPFSENITYINPASDSLSSIGSSYSLASGSIDMSFNFSTANKYDIQACLTTVPPSFPSTSEISIPVPSSIGGGTIGILPQPSDTVLIDPSRSTGNYYFWFQLVGNYSYSISGSSGLATRQIVVAESDTTFIQGGAVSNQSISLNLHTSLRGGRYSFRAFFSGSSGSIQGVNTGVLVPTPLSTPSGNWFWLGSCTLSSVTTVPFVTSFNLGSTSPSGWPSYLYIMYQDGSGGVDEYVSVPLGLSISEVTFDFPASTTPTGSIVGPSPVPSYIGISLANSSVTPIKGFSSSGGSAFLICGCSSSSYPINVPLSLSLGGIAFENITASIPTPYSGQTYYLNFSDFYVFVTSAGKGVQNAKVEIQSKNLNNASASLATDKQGYAGFYIPPGSYSVFVTDLGNSSSGSAQLNVGYNPTYDVSFPPPPASSNPTVYLGTLAVVTFLGLAGNLWFWVLRRRMRDRT